MDGIHACVHAQAGNCAEMYFDMYVLVLEASLSFGYIAKEVFGQLIVHVAGCLPV